MAKDKPEDNFLNDELIALENYIIHKDFKNTDVSKGTVGWHINHTLIAINEIYKVIDTSKGENYKRKFNFARFMMFTFNKIPKGRAKSPKQVKPAEIIITDSIYSHLEQAKKHINKLNKLSENSHFTHPYIGMLNKKQTKRFLKIHIQHHINIIKDILRDVE